MDKLCRFCTNNSGPSGDSKRGLSDLGPVTHPSSWSNLYSVHAPYMILRTYIPHLLHIRTSCPTPAFISITRHHGPIPDDSTAQVRIGLHRGNAKHAPSFLTAKIPVMLIDIDVQIMDRGVRMLKIQRYDLNLQASRE